MGRKERVGRHGNDRVAASASVVQPSTRSIGTSAAGAAGQTGGGSGPGPGSGRPRLEPYGVVWEDLSRADLESWLCRSLFGKQRPRLLSSDEARHALDKRHLPDAS